MIANLRDTSPLRSINPIVFTTASLAICSLNMVFMFPHFSKKYIGYPMTVNGEEVAACDPTISPLIIAIYLFINLLICLLFYLELGWASR